MQNKKQPIENAPKDGTVIILFGGEIRLQTDYGDEAMTPESIHNTVVGHYSSFYCNKIDEWICEIAHYRGTVYCTKPTHWMPITKEEKDW